MTNRTPLALFALAGATIALSFAGGCADSRRTVADVEATPRAYRPAPPYRMGERPIHHSFGQVAQRPPEEQRPRLVARQRLDKPPERAPEIEAGVMANQPGELIPFRYAARSVEVGEALRVIIDNYLGMSYALDPNLNGTVTLDVDQAMTRAEILDTLRALGLMYGWSVERRGDMLYVSGATGNKAPAMGAASTAPIMDVNAALGTNQVAVRIKSLDYISGEDVNKLVSDLMTPGSRIAHVGRTLVFADTTRQLNRISALIDALDQPPFAGVDIWTYQLANMSAERAVETLNKIAQGAGLSVGQDASLAFAAVPNSRRLFVISRDATLQEQVQNFIEQVDMPPDYAVRHRYLYNVQHADPVDLEKLIRDFYGSRIEEIRTTNTANDAAPAERIRLVRDEKRQRFVVLATPRDWTDLIETLETLDTPPQQVHMTTIIAEVQRSGSLQFGVEYFLSQEYGEGLLDFAVSPGLPANPAGSVSFVATDGLAIVQALKSEGYVEILQDPYMFIADGAEGKIQVGGETPYVTSTRDTGQTGTGNDLIQEIEYRDTGVIVTIQPDVNESGLISAKITVEITDVGAQTDLGPEFTTRTLETDVTVPHGHTVLIGGIISRDSRNTVRGIPGLSDIPGAGVLFDNIDDRQVDTELFLALTPRIVNSPVEVIATTSEFLDSARGVRQILRNWENDLPQGMLHNVLTPDGNVIDNAPIPPSPLERSSPEPTEPIDEDAVF